MEQYITKKQLDELSEKGKDNLRKWLVSKTALIPVYRDDFKYIVDLPVLNLGQMMEIIADDLNTILKKTFDNNKYVIYLKDASTKEYVEIRDALWEATKKVLEKQ